MFNPAAYENSRPDGIPVLEIVAPPEEKTPGRLFVPLKRTELRGEVTGPLAALRLVQTFGYTRDQCDRTLEAIYRFPLPGDAAVTGVRVRFGEVEIEAALKERREAEAEYAQAKQEGRQAALATRESPDVFTLQVAGLQPDQEVTAATNYVQLARVEGSDWTLRVPLTTAPRYVRQDEADTRWAQGQPLALLRDPGHRFSLFLNLRDAGSVGSPTHALEIAKDGGDDGLLRVSLQGGEVIPDRDCVLSWRPAREEARPALRVLTHDDPAAGHTYFLALVAPPAATDSEGATVAREVVLLVDHSGSMEGAKWEASDWAVTRFLSGLTERDAFALGLFHNTTRWLHTEPRPATKGTIEEATRFLRNRDSGGTELGVALEQALDLPRTDDRPSRHVLIVTDAEVTDAGRILRLAGGEAAQKERRRISVLCIDAAPNSFLATELAERGGGAARFLTSSPEEEDITTALDEVLEDWAAPVLSGLRLEVDRAGAEASGREVAAAREEGWSAIDLGDLPASGRAVWVAGRVPRNENTDLRFRLAAADGNEVAARRVGSRFLAAAERPALKALFGARRVLTLEYLMHTMDNSAEVAETLRRHGYDPDTVLSGGKKVYAENEWRDAKDALRPLLIREALAYGIACSEAAFVATRTEAGKPVEATVAVVNALPSGWSEGFAAAGGAAPMAAVYYAAPASPSRVLFQRAARVNRPQGLFQRIADAFSPAPLSDAAPHRDAAPADADDLTVADASMQAYAAAPAAEEQTAVPAGGATALFTGTPAFTGTEAVLFDTGRPADRDKLPDSGAISRLIVTFPGGVPDPAGLDAGLTLLLYVGDLAAPRARVRLTDLLRQGGTRPLNLRRRAGETVRLVLLDPAGAWTRNAPRLQVSLG